MKSSCFTVAATIAAGLASASTDVFSSEKVSATRVTDFSYVEITSTSEGQYLDIKVKQ